MAQGSPYAAPRQISSCTMHAHAHDSTGVRTATPRRPIKGSNEDERGLEPGELRARYGRVLDEILMDEVQQSSDARALCSFAARKSGR